MELWLFVVFMLVNNSLEGSANPYKTEAECKTARAEEVRVVDKAVSGSFYVTPCFKLTEKSTVRLGEPKKFTTDFRY